MGITYYNLATYFIRVGLYMSNKDQFEEYCRIIEEYSPCMDDYPYVIDIASDTYYISGKAVERFNVPKQLFNDVINTHKIFVHEEDYPILVDDIMQIIAGKKDHHDIQYRWLDHDNNAVWINCRGRVVKDEEGNPIFMIGCVNEIGNVRAADNISGLLQSSQIKNDFSEYNSGIDSGYALRIGIDGFRDINDKFGFKYGDHVIKEVAECISSFLSEHQYVYHVVADEYIILDANGASTADAVDLYKTVRSAIDGMIEKNKFEVVYTISAGIVSIDSIKNMDYSQIMKFTQFALREAKKRGKNQAYVYDSLDYEKFLRTKKILSELRMSIADDYKGFELFFQPIIKLSDSGDILFAAESLIRFTMSDGEFISPVEFIPILEESGLIIPVGRWILDSAAKMCKRCHEKYPDFKISLNLSYVQILKSALVNEIFNCVGRNGIRPEHLIVEMTESGYLEDTHTVRRVWDNLKRFGIKIAIDDFGTGYSNLQSISRFSPDIVKLDRGFTVKALNNPFERQLMIHVIHLVHSINLKICIEGVETKEELEQLRAMNPDYIQGYFFSRPIPRDEFIKKYLE